MCRENLAYIEWLRFCVRKNGYFYHPLDVDARACEEDPTQLYCLQNESRQTVLRNHCRDNDVIYHLVMKHTDQQIPKY